MKGGTKVNLMAETPATLVPGQFVRHPDHREWGLGQIQSAIGDRITVNFEHAGKQLIIAGIVNLVSATPEDESG